MFLSPEREEFAWYNAIGIYADCVDVDQELKGGLRVCLTLFVHDRTLRKYKRILRDGH